jgi:adenine-specific DNA-methyltransferase
LTLIFSKSPNWQPAKQFDDAKRTHYKNPDNDPNGPWFDGNPLNSPNYRENLVYDIIAPNGNVIKAPANGWRWSKETLKQKMATGEIYFNESLTNIKRKTYLKDLGGLPPSSLWIDLEKTGHNRQAKYELLDLMPENVFDTPKPLKLIKFIINLVNDNKNAIVLDFFSGSGTTGEAVMQLNACDGGNRRFIMVQLPENLDEKLSKSSNDKKLVIKNAINLCDKLGLGHKLTVVSKERLRRAGKKIKDDSPLTTQDLDTGFRVLKLDSSNMQDVYYTPSEFNEQKLFDDNIKPDRTEEDLLFQTMIELGIELSAKIEKRSIAGKTVWSVSDGYLMACFDEEVNETTITEIASQQPYYFVMRDSSLANDQVADNFEQIWEEYSKDTVRRIL